VGKKFRKVIGVGINDADYSVTYNKIDPVTGKSVQTGICPFYTKWRNMLIRCYTEKHRARYLTYQGCTVCKEWLLFSNFKEWMESKDWCGMELDKDLIVLGNKIYSPSTCIFIPQELNKFMNGHERGRGDLLIGVSMCDSKFVAYCNNPFEEGKGRYLGRFSTEIEAHSVWRERKILYALEMITHYGIEEPIANNIIAIINQMR
jgi:hypothetical protein